MSRAVAEPMSCPLSTPVEEHGCYDRRHWRCDLGTSVDCAAVESELSRRGWRVQCRHPSLRSLLHPDGHEIAWVVQTGRFQLRIDGAIAPEERETTAGNLWTCLAQALQIADGLSDPPDTRKRRDRE